MLQYIICFCPVELQKAADEPREILRQIKTERGLVSRIKGDGKITADLGTNITLTVYSSMQIKRHINFTNPHLNDLNFLPKTN